MKIKWDFRFKCKNILSVELKVDISWSGLRMCKLTQLNYIKNNYLIVRTHSKLKIRKCAFFIGKIRKLTFKSENSKEIILGLITQRSLD